MGCNDLHWYSYDGPVMEFDRIIDNHFSCGTYARTPKKALSNMAYSYKMKTGRVANSKITLNESYLKKLGDVSW